MRAYVQAGKLGDVISILPILQHEASKTGQPVPLVIGKEYASILEGVAYVEPVIWKGDVSDLAGAVLFAKKRYSQVIVTQTFGNMPVHHQTPSFQLDQWKRAGAVNHFEEWPLTFDQRNTDRELNLARPYFGVLADERPAILFADHSQSSPFLHKEELYAMLAKEFGGTHRIIRLSEVRAERVFDMLAMMDAADCLVTVETAHLHLSRASGIPTLALAASGWRGSAFSERFKFFMRYPEWDSRKQELIDEVRSILDVRGVKMAGHPPVVEIDTHGRHGYNLSSVMHEWKQHNTYRAHTRGDWRTKLFLNGNPLNPPDRYRDYSHEDARLFVFKDKLHAAYTMSTAIEGQFRCYMAYGEIKGNEIEHIQIQHPENNLMGMTKNFVPFVHENRLYFVYGIKGANQIVLQVDGDRVVAEHPSPAPTWGYGQIRGGCTVAHNGAYLRFFHSRAQYSDKTIRYFIGASIIEAKPPFRTLAVSKKPVLQGDERYAPGVHHWKANVAIPYGCIKQDGKFLLSFGRNDCEACVAELNESDLHL